MLLNSASIEALHRGAQILYGVSAAINRSASPRSSMPTSLKPVKPG